MKIKSNKPLKGTLFFNRKYPHIHTQKENINEQVKKTTLKGFIEYKRYKGYKRFYRI